MFLTQNTLKAWEHSETGKQQGAALHTLNPIMYYKETKHKTLIGKIWDMENMI